MALFKPFSLIRGRPNKLKKKKQTKRRIRNRRVGQRIRRKVRGRTRLGPGPNM